MAKLKLIDEFKKFALKGNVIDMAVGIIIGAAFSTLVKSMVDDIIMPPIGALLGGVDFSDLFITIKSGAAEGPYGTLAAAKAAGAVTLNIGMFINNVISFLIVAWAVFLLVRSINVLRDKFDTAEEVVAEPTDQACPFCLTMINKKATKCPNCTADLPAGWSASAPVTETTTVTV